MSDKAKQIVFRLGLMTILGVVSIAFPYALIPLLWLGWTIWQDIFNPGPVSMPPPLTWRTATDQAENWMDLYFDGCDSPAEINFLRGLIEKYRLQPRDGRLIGGGITVDMQKVFENYRFDFVINGNQVLEIDGATYHSSPEQIKRDKVRDERSISQGYRVTRIPASIVFDDLEAALDIVKKVIAETPNFKQPIPAPRSGPTPCKNRARPKVPDIFNKALGELSAINNYVELQTAIEKFMKPVREVIEKEKLILEYLEREYDLNVFLGNQSEQFLQDYNVSMKKFGAIDKEAKLPAVHWDDLEEVNYYDHDERHIDGILVAYSSAMDERATRLKKLKQRCLSDRSLNDYLYQKLLHQEFPPHRAFEILAVSDMQQYAFDMKYPD